MSSVYLPRPGLAAETRPLEPIYLPAAAACPEPEADSSLGQLLMDARVRMGLTLEQAAAASKVLVSYVEMMESGKYSAIPDPLYLLPFFRRYASFLGLDAARVTASFMRDFEADEKFPAQFSEPPGVRAPQSSRWRTVKVGGLIAAAVSLAAIAARLEFHSTPPKIVNSPAATAPPARLAAETPPDVTKASSSKSPDPASSVVPVVSAVPASRPRTTHSKLSHHRATVRRRRPGRRHHRGR